MASNAQNIKSEDFLGLARSSAEMNDAASVTASSRWLTATFAKRPFLFSVLCILLLTLSGAALSLLLSPSSQTEKLTQIRIQLAPASTQKPDAQVLMTLAQNAVLSDEGTAELAQQIINDGLVLSSVPEATWLGLLGEVVLGKAPTPSDPVMRARRDIRDRITLSQAGDGSALFVTTYAETSGASVRFAQYAANRIVAHINADQPSSGKDNSDIKRTIFEKAEAAVTGFQVRHGAEAMAKMETASQDLALVSRSIEQLEATLADTARNVSSLAAFKGDKALEREIPDDAAFLPLQDIAQQYAAASNTLAQLSVQYGPKHPRVIAATQTLSEIKASASATLRRITSEMKQQELVAKTELAKAKSKQQALEKELAVFGDAPQELGKLEAELEEAREAYFSDINENGPQALNASNQFAVANAPLAVNIANDFRQKISLAIIGGGAGFVSALLMLAIMRYRFFKGQPEACIEDIQQVHDPDMLAQFTEPQEILFADEGEEYSLEPEENFDASDETSRYYGFAANDIPLDQRVREVLMRGSMKVPQHDVAQFPPVIAAAMQGRFEMHAYEEPDELSEVRRDLAILRQRLHDYADRKAASSR